MSAETLEMFRKKIAQLSFEQQKEVEDFVDFLLAQEESKKEKPKPVFGSGKGLFKMLDDFDEPIIKQ